MGCVNTNTQIYNMPSTDLLAAIISIDRMNQERFEEKIVKKRSRSMRIFLNQKQSAAVQDILLQIMDSQKATVLTLSDEKKELLRIVLSKVKAQWDNAGYGARSIS